MVPGAEGDQDHRVVYAGRGLGYPGTAAGRADRPCAGSDGGDREPSGGGDCDRNRGGSAGRARRKCRADHDAGIRDRTASAEAELPSADQLRAHLLPRAVTAGHRRQRRVTLPHARRSDERRALQAGRVDACKCGARFQPAHRIRNAGARGRRQDDLRPISRLRSGRQRAVGRARNVGDRCLPKRGGAAEGRPVACTRHRLAGAHRTASGRADIGRVRLQGLRGGPLVRIGGAGQDAAEYPVATRSLVHGCPAVTRHQAEAQRARSLGHRHLRRRLRRISSQAIRRVRRSHSRGQHQRRVSDRYFRFPAKPARRSASASALSPRCSSRRVGAPPRDGLRSPGRPLSLRGAVLPAPLEPTSSSSRNVNEMRLRGLSTSRTLTRTMSPGFTTWRGSLMKVFDIAEMCTRPSWCTPMSTKAPNAATLVTAPSSTMPGLRSSRVSTPSLNAAALKAGRGSRPGFSNSRSTSVTVGRPKLSSTKLLGDSVRSTVPLPIKPLMSVLAVSRMRRTSG